MLFFSAPHCQPLRHLSSGNLISRGSFLHLTRRLDYYVLLLGCQGTLFLEQDGRPLELSPGRFLLLFPGVTHGGRKPSPPGLSYYWCHFRPQAGDPPQNVPEGFLPEPALLQTHYLLPETGALQSTGRAALLFRQLLDTASRGGPAEAANYALSLLALELSQDLYGAPAGGPLSGHGRFAEILEYVRVNARQPVTVQQLAEAFSYHPDYLSSLFKIHTGVPLLQYLSQIRMGNAKQLLLSSQLTVKEIALSCGYGDPKQFMKRFKAENGMTPTQYRGAFQHKRINSR